MALHSVRVGPARDVLGQAGEAISALAARYQLGNHARQQLLLLLELLVWDPLAPTSIRTRQAALDDHLADSLVALECGRLREAATALDLGAGAGLPGLPLAIALLQTSFTLLESSSRKCRFLKRAVEQCGIANAEVVHARSETFEAGRGRYDVITARAVASLPVTAEYAAPLLRIGGTLIVWRGRREAEMELAAKAAAAELGLSEPMIRSVEPYRGAEHRHLYTLTKLKQTPARFPRRPGIALKRPLGARIPRHSASI
jgi:16S rRNA (guanine527-N7)-methyltransferase